VSGSLTVRWRLVDVPGFTARSAAPGYPGPTFGGDVDGRGAIAMVDGSSTELIELGGGPVTSLDYSDGYLAVSGGTLWGGQELNLLEPFNPTLDGSVVAGWATCADTDHRAVLAYESPDGTVIGVWGYEYGDELVPVPNRLYLRGDVGDVVVTSAQGGLVVAGPVDDGARIDGPTAWLCSDPDFGDEPWQRLPLDPAATAVTGAAGWTLEWCLAGRVGSDVVVWGWAGRAVRMPALSLEGVRDRVLLARCPIDSEELDHLLVVTATGNSAMVHAIDGAGWRSAAMPDGRLDDVTHVHTDDDELLVAVVDGRIFVGELG
jgi:hypothetical protein